MKKHILILAICLCLMGFCFSCKHNDTGPDDEICTRGTYPEPCDPYYQSPSNKNSYCTQNVSYYGEHGKVITEWWWYPGHEKSKNPWMATVNESEDECTPWHETYFHCEYW